MTTKWYSMPTLKRWGGKLKDGFLEYLRPFLNFIKKQWVRLLVYGSLPLLLYSFFWPTFENWLLVKIETSSINTDYYDCALNEFTHKRDNQCCFKEDEFIEDDNYIDKSYLPSEITLYDLDSYSKSWRDIYASSSIRYINGEKRRCKFDDWKYQHLKQCKVNRECSLWQ